MSVIVSKVGWGQVVLSMRRGGLMAQTVITPTGTEVAGGHSPGTFPLSSLKL